MKTRLYYLWYVFMLLSTIHAQPTLGKEPFKQVVIDKAKKAVVTINAGASLSAYEDKIGAWTGTGFMINKQQGLLLTNAHVVGRAVMGHYYVIFHNGKQADAQLVYYDPWLDYAFMKIDPKDMPNDVEEVKFSAKDPEINQPIFVIGNNEAQGFSIHQGVVSSLFRITGAMPQHSINLSLNTKGGSSGSPIFDQNGKAVALNYASSETFGIGLHPQYIRYALPFIEKGRIPKRQHIGAITHAYSLDEAVKYLNFSENKVNAYIKKYPSSFNKVIQVNRTLKDSPAEKKLLPGDIIWAVNGKEIGPNLVDLDLAMNASQAYSIRLQIFRAGEFIDLDITLYNLEAHKIKRMVNFGGVLFFEMNDFWRDINGAPEKALTFAIAQPGTSFSNAENLVKYSGKRFNLEVKALDQTPVHTLDELIKVIPTLIAKKYFTLDYINHQPHYTGFDDNLIVGDRIHKADIRYDHLDPTPSIFTFDDQKMEWQVTQIIP